MPFQTVETVNESAQERQRQLDLFSYSQTSEVKVIDILDNDTTWTIEVDII